MLNVQARRSFLINAGGRRSNRQLELLVRPKLHLLNFTRIKIQNFATTLSTINFLTRAVR
jgi:hypothetical protein